MGATGECRGAAQQQPDRRERPEAEHEQPADPRGQRRAEQGRVGGPGEAGDEARGRGPDEHAGDHPNAHATTKSNNGKPRNEDKPDRGPKKPKDPKNPGSNAQK